jgi:hypothetical protein
MNFKIRVYTWNILTYNKSVFIKILDKGEVCYEKNV